ncbi:MAG: hypothetical protein NW700_17635 [Nitrospiraceae bacterium]
MSKSQLTIPADFRILLKEINARIQQTQAATGQAVSPKKKPKTARAVNPIKKSKKTPKGRRRKSPGTH